MQCNGFKNYYPESGQWGTPELQETLYTEGNNIGLAHGLKLSDATSGNGETTSLGYLFQHSKFW